MPPMDLSEVGAEVEIEIAARAEEVWDLVTDLSLTPTWNRETVETVWVPPATGPVVGAVFRGTNRWAGSEWTVECHVVEVERPRVFRWSVSDPESPSSVWWYRLAPNPDGSTQLQHGFRHGPSGSGLRARVEAEPGTAAEVIAFRTAMLTENMQYTVDRIRDRAERR